MKRLTLLFTVAAISAVPVFCQTSTTGDTSVALTVGPEASITITNAIAALSKDSSGIWGNYTKDTPFTYKMRTTESTGTGSILMKFAGALTSGSNSIALTSLTYACSAMTNAATKCGAGGSVIASSSDSTAVATFGAGKHLTDEAGTVSWTLTDNGPNWKTGDYAATATFTIAAL